MRGCGWGGGILFSLEGSPQAGKPEQLSGVARPGKRAIDSDRSQPPSAYPERVEGFRCSYSRAKDTLAPQPDLSRLTAGFFRRRLQDSGCPFARRPPRPAAAGKSRAAFGRSSAGAGHPFCEPVRRGRMEVMGGGGACADTTRCKREEGSFRSRARHSRETSRGLRGGARPAGGTARRPLPGIRGPPPARP